MRAGEPRTFEATCRDRRIQHKNLSYARFRLVMKNRWEYTGQKRPSFAETPGVGQESVWDYPRPPKLVADRRRVIVRFQAMPVAEVERDLSRFGNRGSADVLYSAKGRAS